MQIISHITPLLDKKKKISIPFNNFKYFRVFSQLSFKTIIYNNVKKEIGAKIINKRKINSILNLFHFFILI